MDFDELDIIEDARELARGPRVYAFSDLHCDHKANLDLLRGLPVRSRDILIVAGDISHQIPILTETLTVLKSKFREVFFCPGNHDLWLDKADGCADSLTKLKLVEDVCARLGVRTKQAEIDGVLFVPLYSWYEPAFDAEPDVTGVDADHFPPPEKALGDFMRCRWPAGLSGSDASLAKHFDEMNEEFHPAVSSKPVISFSHFLPRPELLPEKRALAYPPLAKVVGSAPLRQRVERLVGEASQHVCHIFGHTHYGWSQTLDGVRYLQAAIASPSEWSKRGFALELKKVPQVERRKASDGGLQAFSSCSSLSTMASWSDEDEGRSGPEHGEPALVYDPELVSEKCPGIPQYSALWSDHYESYGRDAHCPRARLWLYRNGRGDEAVRTAVKTLLLEGQQVTDAAVDAQLKLLGPKQASTPALHRGAVARSWGTARAA